MSLVPLSVLYQHEFQVDALKNKNNKKLRCLRYSSEPDSLSLLWHPSGAFSSSSIPFGRESNFCHTNRSWYQCPCINLLECNTVHFPTESSAPHLVTRYLLARTIDRIAVIWGIFPSESSSALVVDRIPTSQRKMEPGHHHWACFNNAGASPWPYSKHTFMGS